MEYQVPGKGKELALVWLIGSWVDGRITAGLIGLFLKGKAGSPEIIWKVSLPSAVGFARLAELWSTSYVGECGP